MALLNCLDLQGVDGSFDIIQAEQEFQRIRAEHSQGLDLLQAGRHLDTALKAYDEVALGLEDAVRMKAAKAVVFHCAAAVASALSFRIPKTKVDTGLLVAFLGNWLDWNRDERSAALSLLNYCADSEAPASAASAEVNEAIGFADATLRQVQCWLAEQRKRHE
ncbi:hypothetical protein CupriaWKF_22960 [Cupriavidus sp. WKF15]|uniref:hypothetical protein n=1 Tax=Cupriavidus sp. WKF15 TaxID=3032282 RepID=UPI0023E33A89|nr:hypothetical protein [Cupriavidus sp. WKF15]WER49967.1 hypothetical protein CupriaWKF_22960 [Cupriavidus sp. WKF15]